jgi:hypothetical protein
MWTLDSIVLAEFQTQTTILLQGRKVSIIDTQHLKWTSRCRLWQCEQCELALTNFI